MESDSLGPESEKTVVDKNGERRSIPDPIDWCIAKTGTGCEELLSDGNIRTLYEEARLKTSSQPNKAFDGLFDNRILKTALSETIGTTISVTDNPDLFGAKIVWPCVPYTSNRIEKKAIGNYTGYDFLWKGLIGLARHFDSSYELISDDWDSVSRPYYWIFRLANGDYIQIPTDILRKLLKLELDQRRVPPAEYFVQHFPKRNRKEQSAGIHIQEARLPVRPSMSGRALFSDRASHLSGGSKTKRPLRTLPLPPPKAVSSEENKKRQSPVASPLPLKSLKTVESEQPIVEIPVEEPGPVCASLFKQPAIISRSDSDVHISWEMEDNYDAEEYYSDGTENLWDESGNADMVSSEDMDQREKHQTIPNELSDLTSTLENGTTSPPKTQRTQPQTFDRTDVDIAMEDVDNEPEEKYEAGPSNLFGMPQPSRSSDGNGNGDEAGTGTGTGNGLKTPTPEEINKHNFGLYGMSFKYKEGEEPHIGYDMPAAYLESGTNEEQLEKLKANRKRRLQEENGVPVKTTRDLISDTILREWVNQCKKAGESKPYLSNPLIDKDHSEAETRDRLICFLRYYEHYLRHDPSVIAKLEEPPNGGSWKRMKKDKNFPLAVKTMFNLFYCD